MLLPLGPAPASEPARVAKPRAARKAAAAAADGAPPAAPAERAETPLMAGWRLWTAAYLAARFRPYVKTPRCGPTMVALVQGAEQLAADLGHPGEHETALAHWFKGYLADGEKFIADNGHALTFIASKLPRYGTPWDRLSKLEEYDGVRRPKLIPRPPGETRVDPAQPIIPSSGEAPETVDELYAALAALAAEPDPKFMGRERPPPSGPRHTGSDDLLGAARSA